MRSSPVYACGLSFQRLNLFAKCPSPAAFKPLVAVSGVICSLTFALPSMEAKAQGPEAVDSGSQLARSSKSGVEQIVVTAQKREERVQTVPISITALSGGQLLLAGVIEIRELPQVTPGLIQIVGSTGNTGQLPIIRGIGSSIAQLGVDASVATYVDGVYLASKYANAVDLNNIARVEVLKGPQGTLFGRNATGGAINIITKRPSDEFEGNASVSYGRHNQTSERLYLTGPLGSNVQASLSVVARQGGDFARNLATDEKFGGQNNITLNAQLAWQPTDRLEIETSFTFARMRDHWLNILQTPLTGTVPIGVSAGGTTSYDINNTQLNFTPLYGVDSYRGHVRMKYSFDDVDLVSITSYQKDNDHLNEDQDGTTEVIAHFDIYARNKAFQQELQLLSTGSGPFEWILGLYYIDFVEHYAPLGLFIPTNLEFDAKSKAEAGAVFGQASYDFGQGTSLTLGLRYSIEKRAMDSTLALAGGGPVLGGPTMLDNTFKKLTWRVSIDHQFTDDIMGYVSYNRGFKSGAFNILSVDPTQSPISPEILDAYEIGIKSQFADGLVQFNAAAYYYDYKNIQVFIVTPGAGAALTGIEAAGSAELYGVEVELVLAPVEGLRLSAGMNLEHSEYTEYDNASGLVLDAGGNAGLPAIFPSLKGRQLFYAPKFSFNVGGSYTHYFGNAMSVVMAVQYAYHSKYEEQPSDGHNFIKAMGQLNASLRFNGPDEVYWLEVWGKNLTNERRVGEYLAEYGLFHQVIRPASFGVTMGARF